MPSTEAIWYYAQDDREHGPVTAAYIAGMAKTGKLRPEDLVWREGMEDWRPARSIRGLFTPHDRPAGAASDTAVLDSPFDAHPPSSAAAEPAAESGEASQPARATSPVASDNGGAVSPQPSPPPVAPADRVRSPAAVEFDAGAPSSSEGEINEFPESLPASAASVRLADEVIQRAGRILMLAGLLLALLSHGCDFAAARSVARREAKARLAQERVDQQQTSQATGANSQPTAEQSAMADAARRMAWGAREAHLNNQAWAFWRGLCFLVGTILFAVGVMPLALAGSGADRWMGIALLAALAFAVFS